MTEETFQTVIYHLRHWLEVHNIDIKGLRLELTFPNSGQLAAAEYYLHREWDNTAFLPNTGSRVNEVAGIKIRFDLHEKPKW